jgi:hypothetical protein
MKPQHPEVPLRDFFAGLTEFAFESKLGVADPPLVDYLVELMLRFVRADSLYHYRTLAGRRLLGVTEMVAEAEVRVGPARRDLHRHIGDYSLFWTGVYPEALPRLTAISPKDQFVDFCAQGKTAYRIASGIPVEEPDTERPVLERLSEEFELCVEGLAEVRREWERRDDGPGRVFVVR